MQNTDCCVVGAGPAGVTLALLLARQGIQATLLEARSDLERDFRGEAIHSSTQELMDQLGIIDQLLDIPHGTIERFMLHTPTGVLPLRAPGDSRSRYSRLLLMPQSRFLEFLVAQAEHYASFQLIFGARVEALIDEAGAVRGVRYRDQAGLHELRATLTVGADGRFSRVRQMLGFQPIGKVQPMDFLWFRLPRLATDPNADGVHVGHGHTLTVLRRHAEWQIAYWFRKGGYQELRAAGLTQLQANVCALTPWLSGRIGTLNNWQQFSVLPIESNRVRQWYRPGVLLIGDAAHVMSPVGGVGVNLAIQDAVAASNILGSRLRQKQLLTSDLAAVQRRREQPTRLIQFMQNMLLRQVIAASLTDGTSRVELPLAARIAGRIPMVATFRDRLFANGGFRPERVTSPAVTHPNGLRQRRGL